MPGHESRRGCTLLGARAEQIAVVRCPARLAPGGAGCVWSVFRKYGATRCMDCVHDEPTVATCQGRAEECPLTSQRLRVGDDLGDHS